MENDLRLDYQFLVRQSGLNFTKPVSSRIVAYWTIVISLKKANHNYTESYSQTTPQNNTITKTLLDFWRSFNCFYYQQDLVNYQFGKHVREYNKMQYLLNS